MIIPFLIQLIRVSIWGNDLSLLNGACICLSELTIPAMMSVHVHSPSTVDHTQTTPSTESSWQQLESKIKFVQRSPHIHTFTPLVLVLVP
ncbi:hypothetical protein BJX76DRAFT_337715 [Aspergillus varians]